MGNILDAFKENHNKKVVDSTKNVRIGIIGTGWIAEAHIAAYKNMPDVEVMKAEKRSGKILTIGFQPRMSENMQMIRKIVESSELGKVYYIQAA